MKAKLDLHRPKNQLPRFPQQRGGWTPTRNLVPRFRDPNAMDTSADHMRARLTDAEEVLERYGQNNAGPYQAPRGQYPPRGGTMRARRGNRTDFREVTCYTCGKKGHISRQCQQHVWNQPPRPVASSSRVINTDYQEQETGGTQGSVRSPKQRVTDWLSGVAGEDDEVKDMILQDLWKWEGFQNA